MYKKKHGICKKGAITTAGPGKKKDWGIKKNRWGKRMDGWKDAKKPAFDLRIGSSRSRPMPRTTTASGFRKATEWILFGHDTKPSPPTDSRLRWPTHDTTRPGAFTRRRINRETKFNR